MFIFFAACIVMGMILGLIRYFLDAYLILRLKADYPEEYAAAGKPLQLIVWNNPIRIFKFSEFILDEQYRWIKDASLLKAFKVARYLRYVTYWCIGLGAFSIYIMLVVEFVKNW